MVNVGLLDLTVGVQAQGGGTKSAVWVISAGANGTIETPYLQAVTTALIGGDDIGISHPVESAFRRAREGGLPLWPRLSGTDAAAVSPAATLSLAGPPS